ncbi:hypothetical protein CRU99_10920 [Malaciobacter mytili]|uniref:sensor histidine kinase n=1 Tax=Malaciobacter mytili TaxID=603050 RepID=UPI00100AA14E|nr:HAMP domain-containing sensor histidine kinase [Malaciobacter mytili]RXI39041.1 hypothetical protein CRU99_10920 [Malaciobacter mytili]
MIYKQNLYKFFTLFIILTLSIIIITTLYIHNKEKNLLNSKYLNTSNNIHKFIKSLIEDKQNATLTIALSLAKDDRLYSYLKNKTYENLEYSKISLQMKEYTEFKNVWIQIIDKYGNSIYRSWSKEKNDNLLFRNDLSKMIKKQAITTSISVGKYDLSIKAKTPIFDTNGDFLGLLEVITHFNSISKKLKENKIEALIIANKKYKTRLQHSLTNTFIDDYYIANLDANKTLITYLKNNNILRYLNIRNYILENDYLINSYILKNNEDENLGSIVTFIKESDIDTEAIQAYKKQMIMLIIIALIILIFIFTFYVYNIDSKNISRLNVRLKKHILQLKIQENKKQSILDSQSNIIVITNGERIINANKQLLKFFKDTKTLSEFRRKYTCVCTAFVDMHTKDYIIDKDYNGKNWAQHVLSKPQKSFKVAMYNHKNNIKHFSLKVSKGEIDNFIIVTLTDITLEIKQKEELEFLNNNLELLVNKKTIELKKLNETLELRINEEIEKSKEKDRLLFQQAKITAIADTLKNIAHQWRQPLSTISTATSGIQIQKEMGILSDEDFDISCKTILNNTKKLSKTIDNFTNFFIEEKNHTIFSLVKAIQNSLKFLSATFEETNIKVDFTYDFDFEIDGYKVEFQQAIINILDNAIYALIEKKELKDRYIFIELNNKVLSIKDSANGIEQEHLSKVLEPYFTTKHQAFGIGLGLYMVQELLIKHMNFKIDVKNCTFIHNNKEYKGANIIIDFN